MWRDRFTPRAAFDPPRLAYERGRKAALYARHGVREYWVIDAQERTASVHREPATAGYRDVAELPREAIL
ncbi:Uma2 family endonuclease, partial [uncultured Methylobacterium sp.]|uniref:Uma2 family endonuclease n=1 Tax=uncultured Methylobacterium sp. TaxID=157278 RepID=UPI0025887C75